MALILVLDEEEDAGQLMRRILTAAGHQAETFTSAEEALEWLRTHNPELALLDLKMRKSDNLGFLRHIRSNRPEIKTLVMAGRLWPEVEKKANELGIGDYLLRPLGIDEIEDHVNRALGL